MRNLTPLPQPGFRPDVAHPNDGPDLARPRAGPNVGASEAPPPAAPGYGPLATGQNNGSSRLGAALPALPETKPCEGTRVLARVGDDVILAGEVIPDRNEIIAQVPKSQLAALPPDSLELQIKALTAKLLEERIQTKLIFQDAKRSIPKEGFPEIERQIGKHFENEVLPKRIEKAGVSSRRELDEKLHGIGSSVERMKREFTQQALASQWLWQQNDRDPEVSHQEMLDYYQEHLADFETPARARWEKLSVRKPRYGDPSEARFALGQMGDQILQGKSVADVLKDRPAGDLPCEGGVQGWLTKGSLEVSNKIEEAIFNLPVGKPSRIFEDGDSIHIVRVLEREDLKRTPFEDSEVQQKIRDEIKDRHRQEQVENYLARLKEQIPVWTVFDDDPELAELRRQAEKARE